MVLKWLIKLTLSLPSGDLRYRARLPLVVSASFPKRVQIFVGKISTETGLCAWAAIALSLVVLPLGLPEINLSLGKAEGQGNQGFLFVCLFVFFRF